MKKLIATLLVLCMLVPSFASAEVIREESPTLTYEELENYVDTLVDAALKSGETDATLANDAYVVQAADVSLTIADEKLSRDTAVLAAELGQTQACPRGLKLGDSLEELMLAYPNDNADLLGTYYEAVLYIDGEKPEATAGFVLRDGQRVTQVNHTVYHWTADGVTVCGVRYALDQGYITDITVYGLNTTEDEAQAQDSLQALSDAQETHEYFAYPSDANGGMAPFGREDFTVGGLDFVDLTPETAVSAFGQAAVDEWTKDQAVGFLRLMQWDAVSAVFLYDANKSFLRVDTLTVSGDAVECARGVRVGDMMDQVMHRFCFNQGTTTETAVTLYGDGVNAPYGVVAYSETTATITYAAAIDDDLLGLWHLTFANEGELQTMRLTLLAQ